MNGKQSKAKSDCSLTKREIPIICACYFLAGGLGYKIQWQISKGVGDALAIYNGVSPRCSIARGYHQHYFINHHHCFYQICINRRIMLNRLMFCRIETSLSNFCVFGLLLKIKKFQKPTPNSTEITFAEIPQRTCWFQHFSFTGLSSRRRITQQTRRRRQRATGAKQSNCYCIVTTTGNSQHTSEKPSK